MTSTLSNFENLKSLLDGNLVTQRDGGVVVSPRTTEEVSVITRYANENRLAIEIAGAGTKRGWGNPIEAGILLETTRLVGVREHMWQDLTATVAVGTTWAMLQQTLAVHGQRIAFDPLWPNVATVGGAIATNDSGVLRSRYGSLRDLIIGMTIVLADGTIAKTGGKVVKNVAGYNLHKLMTGAFGTLGVITSVNFRLHSIPQFTQSFTFSAPAAEPLGAWLLKLLHEQLSTLSVQLRGTAEGFHLDIQIASLPEVLHTQADLLESLARVEGLAMESATAAVWDARQQQLAQSNDFVCKATMLPSEIALFAERVRGLGGESVTQATGIMTASFPAAAAEQLPQLRRELEAAAGSLMVL